jgi:hypothetical protein
MDSLPALTGTFALAFFYFIGAIPAGSALGLSPFVAALVAWTSYVCGVALVVAGGVPLRNWLIKRLKLSLEPDPKQLFWRVWSRYGMTGLALLAPVTLGAQMSALLGIALGAPPLRLLVWMALGAALWSAVIALALTLGLQVVG